MCVHRVGRIILQDRADLLNKWHAAGWNSQPTCVGMLHLLSIRPADTAMFVQPADTAMYLKAAGNRLTQPTHMCLMHSPRYHRYDRLTQPCVCDGVIGGDIAGDLCSLVYSIANVCATG